MLISDIDFSFKVWRNSPWKKDVSFKAFCKYILPYRVYEERPISNWKKKLYYKYHNLIKNIKDIKIAFALVHDSINKEIKRAHFQYPYQLNACEMEKIKGGSCLQRCVYEASVMRALGIPVVMDGTTFWGNYSNSGHTWIALIGRDGLYTVANKDSIARKNNPIDSSIFPIRKKVSNDFPYDTTFKKRCSKITRIQYSISSSNYNDKKTPRNIFNLFNNVHFSDVSSDYNLKSSIIIRGKYGCYCYLCSYQTGYGWAPISFAKNNNGMYSFKNLGDSIIYLPVIYKNDKMIALSNPILLHRKKATILNPIFTEKKAIILDRKYPLINQFINTWNDMLGGIFEGSNNKEFINSTHLYIIKKTPHYRNIINLNNKFRFRYIRYTNPKNRKAQIAEMYLINNNKLIYGKPFCKEMKDIGKIVDGNEFTYPNVIHGGYKLTFDFNKRITASKICFIPKNDGNFVIPSDIYELFIFQKKWISYGKKYSNGHSLIYKNIPSNALFLLKDISNGNEERIFTYNKKQIWW